MAKVLKYYGEGVSDAGQVIRVELHVEGYVGAAQAKRLMADAYDIETEAHDRRDVYKNPLRPTTAQAYLWDPDGALDDEIAAAGAQDVRMVIIENADVVFDGLVIPSPDRRTLNLFPETATIQARCTLADLKNHPFVQADGTLYSGRLSTLAVIQACLSKVQPLDLYTGCELYVPGIDAADNPLSKYFHDAAAFVGEKGYPVSCEEALQVVLKPFHMTVRQSRGAWHAVRRPDLFAGSYLRFRYSPAGALLSSGAFNPAVAVTEETAAELRKATGRQPQMLGYKAVSVAFEHGPVPSLVRNGRFLHTPDRDRERRGRPGSRSRGRGYSGSYTRPTQAEQQTEHWTYYDGSAEVPLPAEMVTRDPFREGSNCVRLEPAPLPEGASPLSVITQYVRQADGRTVQGGGGRRIRTHVACFPRLRPYFVDEDPEPDEVRQPGGRVPVYYRVILENVSDGTKRYLTRTGSWQALPVPVVFGITSRSGTITRPGAAIGEWNVEEIVTDELPEGTWRVQTLLYQSAGAVFQEALYWAEIDHQLINEELFSPEAQVVTAYNPASKSELIREESIYFGDAPVSDMVTALTLEDGSAATNWKESPYGVGDPPSGVSLTEMLARSMFREQAETVAVHAAGYIKGMPRVWPHQVLELDGARYEVGAVTYKGARHTQAGEYVRVRQFGISPEIDLLEEEGAGTFIGDASDMATRALIALQDDVFNRALQNPIAKTLEVIAPTATPDTPVTAGSVAAEVLSAIEAGDGLILIAPDGRDFQLVADENREEGAETVAFEDFEFTAPVPSGAGIYPRNAEIKSLLVQTRDAIRLAIEGDVISWLGDDVDLDGTETDPALPLAEPTRYYVRNGDELEITDSVSGAAKIVTAFVDEEVYPDGRLPKLSMSIPLAEGTELQASEGSEIRFPNLASLRAQIQVMADEIVLGVSQETLLETIETLGEPTRIGVVAGAVTDSTTIELVSPLEHPLPDGAELRLRWRKDPWDSGSVLLGATRLLQGARSAGEDTLTLQSPITLPLGAEVFYRFTEIVKRMSSSEGQITILSSEIDLLVSQIDQVDDDLTTLEGEVQVLAGQVVLKASQDLNGDITSLALVELDATMPGSSSIRLKADTIDIDGLVTLLEAYAIEFRSTITFYNDAIPDATRRLTVAGNTLTGVNNFLSGGTQFTLSPGSLRIENASGHYALVTPGEVRVFSGIDLPGFPPTGGYLTDALEDIFYLQQDVADLESGKANAVHTHTRQQITNMTTQTLQYKDHSGVNQTTTVLVPM